MTEPFKCRCEMEYEAWHMKGPDQFWTFYGADPREACWNHLPVLDCCKKYFEGESNGR